ncbi:OmpA family protein [Pedobacter sp. MW01-1-1]|uniref:OmpA family protein n=1 Tax=Pedobacter sp. MW01-1-1 TaxID=3383027 RepID=UPI003FF03812
MVISKVKIATLSIGLAVGSMTLQSCDSLTKTQKGAGIGVAAGAGLGALIGKAAGNTAVGAIIGGAIGGTAGALIGKKMDKQAAEIQKAIPNAEVIREGEGIIVKFDNGILFDINKAVLKDAAKSNIQSLAASLNQYPDTDIKVIGHTDSTGTLQLNMNLSEKRASAVKAYAVSQGVPASRLVTIGKGPNEPIADNKTEAGRAENRRVEIVIVASEKLKQEAKQQG